MVKEIIVFIDFLVQILKSHMRIFLNASDRCRECVFMIVWIFFNFDWHVNWSENVLVVPNLKNRKRRKFTLFNWKEKSVRIKAVGNYRHVTSTLHISVIVNSSQLIHFEFTFANICEFFDLSISMLSTTFTTYLPFDFSLSCVKNWSLTIIFTTLTIGFQQLKLIFDCK